MSTINGKDLTTGYALFARAVYDSRLWQCPPDVWKLATHLILSARHKHEPKKFPGFEIKRGELVTSLSDIADACQWYENRKVRKWSRQKVSRMLEQLKEIGFLTDKSDTYGTHLSICNYESYQTPDNYKSDNFETTVEQPCNNSETAPGTNKNAKNGDNVKNEKKSGEKKFVPPSIEEVRQYCQERKNNIDPQSFVDFYQSKNWYVGKNKMKDWQAAVRTWEKKDNSDNQQKTSRQQELEDRNL